MSHKKASRCRNFNDDGGPIGRGCTRGECLFLHPSDPAWAQANRRRNSDVNSNQSGPSYLPGNSGWGSRNGPPSKKTPSKDWDTSLWDSPSKKTDDGWSTKRRNSQSSAKKDGTAASPTSSVSNDWIMTTNKGESSKSGTGGGWGNTNSTGGWGVTADKGEPSKSGTGGGWGNTDPTGGWGVTTDKGEPSKSVTEGGWGNTDPAGSWGAGNTDNTTGWGGGEGWGGGVSDELGAWGGGKTGDNTSTSGNDQKGKKREKEREDIEMRDSSPPRTVGSLKHTSLSHTKSESTPLPPARNTPPPSTVASKPARPIPLPLPSKLRKALFEDGNLTKLALQSAKHKEAEQVQEKPNSLSVHGPKGRADLYSQVLKHTSTVVVLQAELQRAQRDLARWKRTQESAQYERASHATRVILDQNRAMFNLRVQEAKRRLERALTALVDLPDFASRNHKNPGPILTKETIEAYTAELRDWFSDVELHKRILMEKEKEKAAAQTDLPPAPVEQLTAQQLMERGKWSWNEIKISTNELNTRILSTAEHLYSDVYTTIADLKDQAAGLQDPRPLNLSAATTTTTKGNHQFDALSSTANLVGDNLSAQANRTAELISKIHALEQEYEHLEDETRRMNKFCADAEAHFSQFEQWRQDDVAKIQDMTEQLRTAHLQHKPPKMPIPTLPPAQLDGIVLQLRPVIIDNVQKEVQTIFDALRSRCLENLEGMKDLIEELVTPALVMTDDICHRVSTLSCDETSDFK